jgi:hypothetical protein
MRAIHVSCAAVAALALVVAGSVSPAYAAGGVQQWQARYEDRTEDGSRIDAGEAIEVDAAGNVYVGGRTYSDDRCCVGFSSDYLVVKYDGAGRQVWTQRYDGPAHDSDAVTAVALDDAGNVYVTGSSVAVADLYDQDTDFVTIKYSPFGQRIWVARWASADHGYDYPVDIAVDTTGDVYVTGLGSGSGIYDTDFTTVKYSSTGVQQWVQTTPGTPSALTLDSAGNVYVTGSDDGDYLTLSYTPAGATRWSDRWDGPDEGFQRDRATGLTVDRSGNVYVTGTSWTESPRTFEDIATVKYGPGGQRLWVKMFDAVGYGNDEAAGIAVDQAGNVYVAGTSYWGYQTYDDYVLVSYTASGNQRWVRTYAGIGGYAYEEAVEVAFASGSVLVTGYSDSSFGYYRYDYATVAFDTSGMRQWAARYDGPIHGYDVAAGLATDRCGNVYVTGQSAGGTTEYDIATVNYSAATPTC